MCTSRLTKCLRIISRLRGLKITQLMLKPGMPSPLFFRCAPQYIISTRFCCKARKKLRRPICSMPVMYIYVCIYACVYKIRCLFVCENACMNTCTCTIRAYVCQHVLIVCTALCIFYVCLVCLSILLVCLGCLVCQSSLSACM